jgi:hypothetical protein
MSLSSALLNVNWWAVLVAGILNIAVGLIWYQPRIFGAEWIKLSGKDLNPARQWIPAGMLAHLVAVYVLAVIFNLAGVRSVLDGVLIAILTWLGFIVTLEAGELVWEKIPFKLFLLRIGEHLLAMSLSGIILAIWR